MTHQADDLDEQVAYSFKEWYKKHPTQMDRIMDLYHHSGKTLVLDIVIEHLTLMQTPRPDGTYLNEREAFSKMYRDYMR